jgi:hypothetical protein
MAKLVKVYRCKAGRKVAKLEAASQSRLEKLLVRESPHCSDLTAKGLYQHGGSPAWLVR